jgi:hypothetical protein
MFKRSQLPGWTDLPFAATFGGTTVAVVLTCLLAPLPAQIAVVGTISALMLGLLLTRDRREAPAAGFRPDSAVVSDREDDETHRQHRIYAGALTRIVQHNDPLFRSLAPAHGRHRRGSREIASGTIVFEDTETWRLAYEELLRSPGLYLYRSAALVSSPAYWRDEPGRRSMRLNYEMQDGGTLSIERTHHHRRRTLAVAGLSSRRLAPPLDQRAAQPRDLDRLVRLSALAGEPDLQADFGIYGSRAVGRPAAQSAVQDAPLRSLLRHATTSARPRRGGSVSRSMPLPTATCWSGRRSSYSPQEKSLQDAGTGYVYTFPVQHSAS